MDKLDRITIHWSVTPYQPTPDCYTHYHYIYDNRGEKYDGNRPPESNLHASVLAGTYQEHCGGGNTGCIGHSMAAMLGYEGPNCIGHYPITEQQFESCMKGVAEDCKKYNIPVTPDTVFTHYEFGLKHPESPSAGKIDINFLPHMPHLHCGEVGDFIRKKVQWYIDN
jgi:hypothetical protein